MSDEYDSLIEIDEPDKGSHICFDITKFTKKQLNQCRIITLSPLLVIYRNDDTFQCNESPQYSLIENKRLEQVVYRYNQAVDFMCNFHPNYPECHFRVPEGKSISNEQLNTIIQKSATEIIQNGSSSCTML